ncbi:DNA gyrase inhibitor YacG [Sphaerotilus sp.]|jgi:uncharacterized protein|uniref:DNA gyrase inhibitor YacG n=1 Tax=Sphaerotilus sp. TaxID=2093942 RepID=UPI0026014789|nr:DNA gyrase inhibitor YacG [Sphaerotilus sp.]
MNPTNTPAGAGRPAPQVPCPSCREMTLFAPSNPWRPFCSERCRQRDFGAWASESFRVAAVEPPDDQGSP